VTQAIAAGNPAHTIPRRQAGAPDAALETAQRQCVAAHIVGARIDQLADRRRAGRLDRARLHDRACHVRYTLGEPLAQARGDLLPLAVEARTSGLVFCHFPAQRPNWPSRLSCRP